MPFSGRATQGYDANKKEYVSLWVDSMAASVMELRGNCDATATVFTMRGDTIGMTGPVKTTDTTTIKSDDERTMVMKSVTPAGEDAGTMTLDYKRTR